VKRRECSKCALRFKSQPRRIAASRQVCVTCPRCGTIMEVDEDEMAAPSAPSRPH
jgi:RNase P subunit RPR2